MVDDSKNKKRFVFIDSAINSFYYGVNQGVAALIPIAKRNNFEVSLIYLNKEISAKKFRRMIEKLNPDVVGFSLMWPQIKYIIKYSKAIADLPNVLKICGGAGASLAPDIVLEKANIDGVLVGEGEIPLEDFLQRINKNQDVLDTPGFYWWVNGQIKNNSIPPFVTDLSALPFPDYSLYPRSLVVQWQGKNIAAKMVRGCPFACTYCSNKELSSFYPEGHKFFRLPPVEYAINLLKDLLSQYPEAEQINFSDETLTADKEWFKQFIKRYAQEIKLRYTLMSRLDGLDTEVIDLMGKSGCLYVWVGLESGDEELRKELLGRYYSNELFIKNAQLLKEAGIQIYTFNMFALPFETKEQMEKTVWLNKEIKADRGQCSFYYPFPKTKMYSLCKENNLLLEEDAILNLNNYNSRPAIKLINVTEKDCLDSAHKLVSYFADQEKNPWFRMEWYKFYEKDGTLKTSIKLFFFYNFAKIKYLLKTIYLFFDRGLGNLGIFLKNNFPNVYYSIRGHRD